MPLELTPAPEQKTSDLTMKQITTVFGDSGTQRYSGYYQEESNPIWRDEDRVDNVEEMRRTDGTIQAVLVAVKAPILATDWRIEGEDEKIVEFVEENLFHMNRSWRNWLREALTCFDFGHSVFELVWEKRDGGIYLADMEPRIQRSISRWELLDRSPGIIQWVRTNDDKRTQAQIPMDKLLVLTNDKEGDDITGRSILRAAWKHYKNKDVMYRVAGISAERYGVGIPVVTLGEGFGDDEKAKAEEMAKNIRSNEKSFVVLPSEDWTIRIMTPDGNPQADQIEKLIEHHDRKILMSSLAGFLGLGADSTGSFALSKDQSGFFLKSVEDKAHYIAEEITQQVIKKLVRFNFGPTAEVPKLVFNSLGDIDFKEMSDTLKTLSDSKLIVPTPEVKKWTHKIFKMPDVDDEEIAEDEEKQKQMPKPNELPIKKDEEEKKKLNECDYNEIRLSEIPFKPFRSLTDREKRSNFELLNETFNKREQSIEDELSQMSSQEIERYLKRVESKIEAKDIIAIGLLGLSLRDKVKKNISENAKLSFDVGKNIASREMKVSPGPTPKIITQSINSESKDLGITFETEIENTGRNTIRDAVLAGVATKAIITATRDKMQDKASQLITNVSGMIPGQYINKGRRQVFEDNLTLISKFERSEVLDGRTCNMCLSLDGRVVKADDPMAKMDLVHTHCRGIWIPVFVSEEQPALRPMPKTVMDSFDLVGGKPVVNSFKQLKKPINKANQAVQKQVKKNIKK